MATELAHRYQDGVDVRPLWNRAAGRVSVAVAVPDTGEAFELVVRGSERPLEVFLDPFTFAALRTIDARRVWAFGGRRAAAARAHRRQSAVRRALLTEYPRELADEPDGPLPVPRSYEAVVASRVDGCPPEARRLAEGAAGLISA